MSVKTVKHGNRTYKSSKAFRRSRIKVWSLCGIISVMLILPGCSQGFAETDVTVVSLTNESTALQTQQGSDDETIESRGNNQTDTGGGEEADEIADMSHSTEDYDTSDAANADIREEDMAKDITQEIKLGIRVGEELMTATLEENSSAEALITELEKGDFEIDMHDFSSFEKVGPLGVTLPTNDKQITTGPGDVILYQGNQFVIYYDTNSWNFTQLAKIDDLTQDDLKRILGDGDVSVTLTLIRD